MHDLKDYFTLNIQLVVEFAMNNKTFSSFVEYLYRFVVLRERLTAFLDLGYIRTTFACRNAAESLVKDMFENLQERFERAFKVLKGHGSTLKSTWATR